MRLGDHIITFSFPNSLLLQASLRLIPTIEISIYFYFVKKLSITLVLSLPRPPSKRSEGASALTAPACLCLRRWRQVPFVLPNGQLKMTATNPPIQLPSNPYPCTYSLRSQLSDKNYSGYRVRSLSYRQPALSFQGCSLIGPISNVFIIAVKSSLLSPLPVACGARHLAGSAAA